MTENQRASATGAAYADWKKKTAVFLAGQTLSMFGSSLVMYAILWHITLTTQSGWILTISTLTSFLPQIIISLFAGVWADRYNRKFLIIGADLLTAVSTLILAVVFMLGYRELWLLFLVAGIRSIGAGIQSPAVGAFLPQIVPPENLLRVNGINGTIHPFMMILAPVTAGALMTAAPLETLFFIDVVTALLAVGLLMTLKVAAHHKAASNQKVGYLDDLKYGLRYIAANRAIKVLFAFFAFVMFLIAPAAFLTPLLVARSFGEEVWRLTANEVTFFAGMILGGIFMTAWGGFKSHFRTIGLGCILCGLLFAGLGLAKDFTVYLVLMGLAGLPMPMFNVPTTTLLQESVEPDLQGRVFGVLGMIQTVALPLGMLIFGPIADSITIELLLVITGVLMVLPGLWIFFNRPAMQPEKSLSPAD